MGKKYKEHPEANKWDHIKTHEALIMTLEAGHDGWAMSASSQSLRAILPLCPESVRVVAWVKPFAAFKKNVNPSYAWEPIIVKQARPRSDSMTYMRDWAAENITLKKGLTGAKPENLCYWIFDVLNMQPQDNFYDLFPGTGIVGDAWQNYKTDYEKYASKINRVSYKWEMGKGAYR